MYYLVFIFSIIAIIFFAVKIHIKKIEIINLGKQGRSYTFHAMKLGATSNVKARQNGKQLYILVQIQRQVNLFR